MTSTSLCELTEQVKGIVDRYNYAVEYLRSFQEQGLHPDPFMWENHHQFFQQHPDEFHSQEKLEEMTALLTGAIRDITSLLDTHGAAVMDALAAGGLHYLGNAWLNRVWVDLYLSGDYQRSQEAVALIDRILAINRPPDNQLRNNTV